jgi:DNA-binding NarL/FixJ family response regulator
MPMIRMVLAEDIALVREGISHMIEVEEELDLVGVASDLPERLALVVAHEPDVVVTDIRMPPTGTDEGIQVASWIRKNPPTMGVVVLSQYTAPTYALALLEAGSTDRAHLLKKRVAGKVALFHHKPDRPDNALDEIEKRFTLEKDLVVASESMVLEL